jgi:hypothetical protein
MVVFITSAHIAARGILFTDLVFFVVNGAMNNGTKTNWELMIGKTMAMTLWFAPTLSKKTSGQKALIRKAVFTFAWIVTPNTRWTQVSPNCRSCRTIAVLMGRRMCDLDLLTYWKPFVIFSWQGLKVRPVHYSYMKSLPFHDIPWHSNSHPHSILSSILVYSQYPANGTYTWQCRHGLHPLLSRGTRGSEA